MAKMKRCPLSRRIPRDLIKNCGKYLGMVVILVCVIAIGSSFQTTLDGAINYLDGIKEGNLREDGFFETAQRLGANEDNFYAENGITLCENFYVTENDFLDTAKLLVFNERNAIDIPTVFEGRLPQAADEIALDHVFARGKEIEIGDTVKVLGKDFRVSGTVSLPDYSSLFLNNTDLVMNTSHFCVSVVSREAFDAFNEHNVTCRYS